MEIVGEKEAQKWLLQRVFSAMVPPRGIEPPTYRLGGGRSIRLSYGGKG